MSKTRFCPKFLPITTVALKPVIDPKVENTFAKNFGQNSIRPFPLPFGARVPYPEVRYLNNLVRLSLFPGGGAVPALADSEHEGGDGGDATDSTYA